MDEIKAQLKRVVQWDLKRAKYACDPIEFQRRQQKLLYSIADYLTYEEGITQEPSEACQPSLD